MAKKCRTESRKRGINNNSTWKNVAVVWIECKKGNNMVP